MSVENMNLDKTNKNNYNDSDKLHEDINNILKKPIQSLKGIGESRAKLFHKLGIDTVEDLISYYPRTYEDRSNVKKIADLLDDESCSFEAVISSPVRENRIRRGLVIYKVRISDDTADASAVWFNQSYLKNKFTVGEKYYFYGKASRKFGKIEVQNPVFEKATLIEARNTCRIMPVYGTTAGLTENILRLAIRNALKLVGNNLHEFLPKIIRDKNHLSEINYAIGNIHFPETDHDFSNARYRLVFEELFLLQLGLTSIKNLLNRGEKGIVFKKTAEEKDFVIGLPFKLTDSQRKVMSEIISDMESSKVMNRLVQGDVGSGKTILAVISLLKTVKNGYQGTLMVPTEILAEQHYRTMKDLLAKQDIRVGLLVGSLSASQKKKVREEIESGLLDIVIGTHALIEESVKFKKLGLVITDEQHRFGVRQRASLSKKGMNPDVIVMTATPIPRTLALILYGDLDISIIDELPPGREKIDTYNVDNMMRQRIDNFIRKTVGEGRQVYIVCPLVEESESIDAKAAQDIYERIANKEFTDLKVGLLHGRMKTKEKEQAMKSFVDGEIDILVSTTVIEVGVDVPNASVMVIENAERFGLAQLHQLRGRVGRGSHKSYCILFSDSKSEIAVERMKIMQKTNDGFLISDKDLELRGPGEFFGVRQHGLPELKIANLYNDLAILKTAQAEALNVLKNDPLLEKEENKSIKLKVSEFFSKKLDGISLN
jgi:ATP-dependent DNA helicase RecG